MLTLKDIRYFWGPQPVLDSVSLFVGRGEKAGLVGANGAGKTTLLRIAAGEITPDGGRVGPPWSVRAACRRTRRSLSRVGSTIRVTVRPEQGALSAGAVAMPTGLGRRAGLP